MVFVFLFVLIEVLYGIIVPYSTQVHIAMIPDNQMSISWITDESYDDKPILYITDVPPINGSIINTSTLVTGYTIDNTFVSRYYHHAITPSLIPMTKYYYQPGINGSIYSFISPNNNNNSRGNSILNPLVNTVMFGDMGIINSENTTNLLKYLVSSNNIDFIVHNGDISYSDDRSAVLDDPVRYIDTWDKWGNNMEPIFSKIPYHVTPGNHEQTCHSWADINCSYALRNFSTYRNYFRMPMDTFNEVGGGAQNMWHSFTFNGIHFLQISTETDYEGSPDKYDKHTDKINPEAGGFGDQMSFIENDLLNAYNDPNIHWIIVSGHRAPYSSVWTTDHPDWPPQTEYYWKKAFENLLYKYNVDVYFGAHIHSYERLFPIYNGNITSYNYVNPLSTVYINNGAAGSIEGHDSSINKNDYKNYTVLYDNHHFGVGQLIVVNITHAKWNFISANDNTIIDSIWIQKGHWM